MAQVTVQQAMDVALQHHRAGRLAEAEAIYRQVLTAHPEHGDALNLLGVVAFQIGRYPVAEDLIRRAIALGPRVPDYHYNLGQTLAASGRHSQAVEVYRRALELRPNHFQAWNNLGAALHSAGQSPEAVVAFRRSLELKPDYAQAHYNLGTVLDAMGLKDEAIDAYRQSLAAEPGFPEAWNNLGNSLRAKGDVEGAIAAYRRATELRPDHAEALSNLGGLLQESEQADEMLALVDRAISLQPDSVSAHHNRGNVLRSLGRNDDAIAAFRTVVALKPDFADGFNGLGYALRETGDVDASIAAYQQALAISPDNARAHHNLGAALLLKGDYAQGWPHHEWRFAANDPNALALHLDQPRWDGGDLQGKIILLHAEQAFGDTIQFARYVPMVQQRGGTVIFQCHPELARVMRGLDPSLSIIPRGEALPAFDVHCPLLSLPMLFGTTVETIPAAVPYLHVEPELSAQWRERLEGEGMKIGLVWSGRTDTSDFRKRTLRFDMLSPLARIDARFFSLQKGDAALQAWDDSAALKVTHLADELHDFADTAALIENLDLVISIDTAVAHLAGALGKRVWVMLPFVPDWRWMLKRDDSPWYPTMRLFRQQSAGDWATVISLIVRALERTGADLP